MAHLYFISPETPILQNVDYFLYNLEIEWGKKQNSCEMCFKELVVTEMLLYEIFYNLYYIW